MSTRPTRPGIRQQSETERIVRERLATVDEDAKTATDARKALAAIRKNLQRPKPH